MSISAESIFFLTPKLRALSRRNGAKCSKLRKLVQMDSRKQSACLPPVHVGPRLDPRQASCVSEPVEGERAQPRMGTVHPDSTRASGSGGGLGDFPVLKPRVRSSHR